ncbi:MAG: hypothetical protein JWQ28_2756 [Pedobacter sp.]|nr:hypothetical protein [Pedobacter sp.]
MEQPGKNDQEEKKGLKKTAQLPLAEEDLEAGQLDKEHCISSEKKIDLSDEDQALDSGI